MGIEVNKQSVFMASTTIAACAAGYSIFDSALCRNPYAKWLFPQEKAPLHDVATLISESKML